MKQVVASMILGLVAAAAWGEQPSATTSAPVAAAAQAPSGATVIQAPAGAGQSTVIVVTTSGCQIASNAFEAAPAKAKRGALKEKQSNIRMLDDYDTLRCAPFKAQHLFQWGSCRQFFGERP